MARLKQTIYGAPRIHKLLLEIPSDLIEPSKQAASFLGTSLKDIAVDAYKKAIAEAEAKSGVKTPNYDLERVA